MVTSWGASDDWSRRDRAEDHAPDGRAEDHAPDTAAVRVRLLLARAGMQGAETDPVALGARYERLAAARGLRLPPDACRAMAAADIAARTAVRAALEVA